MCISFVDVETLLAVTLTAIEVDMRIVTGVLRVSNLRASEKVVWLLGDAGDSHP